MILEKKQDETKLSHCLSPSVLHFLMMLWSYWPDHSNVFYSGTQQLNNVPLLFYLVPCTIDKNEYFLKTIIPSRKATKKYIGGHDG